MAQENLSAYLSLSRMLHKTDVSTDQRESVLCVRMAWVGGMKEPEEVYPLRRFKHWAYLNAEGKKLYGEVFPDGEVPVLSMFPQVAKLEGIEEPERCFIVYWNELSDEQQQKILERLSKRSGVSKDIIKADIEKTGLPLRQKYTSGSGTNHPGFFI